MTVSTNEFIGRRNKTCNKIHKQQWCGKMDGSYLAFLYQAKRFQSIFCNIYLLRGICMYVFFKAYTIWKHLIS